MRSAKRKLKIDKLRDGEVDSGVLSQINSVSDIFSQFASRVETMASRLDDIEGKVNTLTDAVSMLSAASVVPPNLTLGDFTTRDAEDQSAKLEQKAVSSESDTDQYLDLENTEGTEGVEDTEDSSTHSPPKGSVQESQTSKGPKRPMESKDSGKHMNDSLSDSDDDTVSVISVQTNADDDDEPSSILTSTPYYNDPILVCENNVCNIGPSSDGSGYIQVVVDILNPDESGYIYLWLPREKHISKMFENISSVTSVSINTNSEDFKLRITPKLLCKGKVECKFVGTVCDSVTCDNDDIHTLSFVINYTL